MRSKTLTRTWMPATLTVLMATVAAHGGFNQTGAGPFDYNDTNNWVGGTIDGIWDSSLILTASQTLTFGADTALSTALQFGYDVNTTTDNVRNILLRADGTGPYTLTLGGDITVAPLDNETVTFGSATANQVLNVDLGGVTRNFTVTSGRTLSFTNVLSNGGIIASGGTLNFSAANTYSGATVINSGNFSLNGATGSAVNSDFTVNANATTTLTFRSDSGSGTTRAKSVTLNGIRASGSSTATLSVTGNAASNTIDSISGALTMDQGYGLVSLAPNGATNTRLTADSFVQNARTVTFFRGTNLGVNTLASQTAGSANISFTNAPSLVGGGGAAGTTTVSILPRSYGAITTSNVGDGLVTYDSTNGIRVLNTSTEYTAAISNGQTQLDNVRYVRTSGGAAQDINLTAATTTINSLSFDITGAGTNSGVTISGDAGTTLKLNSGTIFARQAVTTANATDAMVVSVPTLDLNGREGTFISFTNGVNNANTPAPLQINSSIANDGGNGVTIGGTGQVIFGGSTAHSYTGVTTINSGILRLAKTSSNIGIPGDLVINAGTLLKNSNAIPDSADVTINGGTFWMDTTSSSGNNGHQETVNNFTINGGSFGNHGSNAVLNINGNASINGSQLGMNQGGDITVLGTTTLNGGLLLARESSSDTVFNALTTLNHLAITNPTSGQYTAMTLNSHATRQGALVTINGNVTFTGNGTNANTALINSSDIALANQGVIALNGTRTFTIGNGAAAVDLAVVPALIDGSSTGGLIKAGLGTLALHGANTYGGSTAVNAGVLKLGAAGSIAASPLVTINAGAALDTTDQSFTMLGGQTFTFVIDPAGAGSAGLLDAAALDIGAGVVDFSTLGTLNDTAYVFASYSSLTGTMFAGVSNLPAGYSIDYNYLGGNDIALVIPEPGTLALLALGTALMLKPRKRVR